MFSQAEIKEIMNEVLATKPELVGSFGEATVVQNAGDAWSVTVNDTLVLRVHNKRRGQEVSVKQSISRELAALDVELLPIGEGGGWVYFSAEVLGPNFGMHTHLMELLFTYIYKLLKSDRFGCCSRYVECSDRRRCIHPDLSYSLGCTYRGNLEAGRIFYGKNAFK